LAYQAGARVAANYGRRFDLATRRLVQFPRSGSPRPALGASARMALVDPYLLIYAHNLEDDAVILLRILHERRNIARAWPLMEFSPQLLISSNRMLTLP
jgi:plasmid stabilization system protein ParE